MYTTVQVLHKMSEVEPGTTYSFPELKSKQIIGHFADMGITIAPEVHIPYSHFDGKTQ